MKIIIITQNEPFFLRDNFKYLISILSPNIQISGVVVNDVSPFGKKESFLKKSLKTYKIFGLNFFLFYSLKYLKSLFFHQSLKSLLHENKIPIIELSNSINSSSSISKIKSFKPDLLVSILGNQIFKSKIINLAPKGCINLHTALLPKYRGLMPTFWVLKNHEEFTGVSVFFVDEGIDSGDIILQKKIKIDNMTQYELIKITKKIGMELIAKAIHKISINDINLIENNDFEMTYYSFPNKRDVQNFIKSGKKFF